MSDQTWARTILREIDERGDGLTAWESDFIESITRQLEAGSRLTEAQEQTLARIHDERV